MQKRYTKTVLSLLALLVFMFGATGSAWAQVNLRIGDISGTAGDSIEIPVTASDLSAEQVTSYQFTVSYDADIVEITSASTEGTISTDGSLEFNAVNGEARVAYAGDQPLSGSGTLVVLKGVLGNVGDSPLSFSGARLFDQQAQDVAVTTSGGALSSGVGVTLPDAVGLLAGDQTIQVPVEVDDVSGQNITAYQFTVSYDPSIINITGATGDGSLSSDGSLDANPGNGSINVAFASSSALEGSGDLVYLEVELLSEGTSPLNFDAFSFFNAAGDEVNNSATDGSVTAAPPARAQIIHNAADPAADPVDVYVNGDLTLDDFAFRSATPFLDLPAGVELNVGVAPGNSESAADTLANFPLTLEDGQSYTVVANGVLNPADFADNPDGASTAFTLFVAPNAQEAASGSGSVDVRAVHGATDAPTVDIIQVAGATLLDDVSYGAISPYLPVSPEATVVTVAPGAGGSPVAAFEVNLAGAGGSALTVLASGFLNPANNQDGAGFRLVGVFPDGSVQVLQPLAFPQDVSVSVNQAFDDATVQDNYALVGLPGQVDLPIANTVEGESPDDWRAFWDNGSASVDEGLVEFDGSDTFNFRPGRGFWLLSKNPWTVSDTYSPISLNADGTGSISVHSGWNIISNPFGKTIPWGAVQSANGASQDLWRWNGSFNTLTSFQSASNGEAFYFLNDGGLSQLDIPFFLPSGSSAAVASKTDASESKQLTLTAFHDGNRASAVRVGLSDDAAEGRDNLDQFAPPAHFSSATMRLTNEMVQSEYAKGLAADYRPLASSGQRFNLELAAEAGDRIMLKASGLEQFQGQEVRLVNTSNSVSYNLHESGTVTVRPESETSNFVLLVGSGEFVESQESQVVPDQIKLLPNYPNPFRGQTTLRFALPEQQDVRLVIYDVLGRTVRTLVNDQKQSGVHSVRWNGRNDAGQPVASGLYLGRLEVGETTQVTKLLLVK